MSGGDQDFFFGGTYQNQSFGRLYENVNACLLVTTTDSLLICDSTIVWRDGNLYNPQTNPVAKPSNLEKSFLRMEVQREEVTFGQMSDSAGWIRRSSAEFALGDKEGFSQLRWRGTFAPEWCTDDLGELHCKGRDTWRDIRRTSNSIRPGCWPHFLVPWVWALVL